ncbi:hypothetical protein [Shewanella sp.]|jgi:hypothetical protein|uniref:hypothetical protein n=1 Tax=Shewanella sp. TaxID=50422 RepID=UPI0040489F00
MHRNTIYTFLLISLLALQGCVAPGSAIGNLKISGSVVSSADKPVANKQIEFMLPAAYGLGGLDLLMNSPEDFGYTDHRFVAKTDENGNFEVNLGERIYHISFWLLPPLGGFPSRPPAPFLFARFPDSESEYYAIQTHDGSFKIYNYSGKEIPLAESLLKEISAINKEGDNTEFRETIGVIKLKLRPE